MNIGDYLHYNNLLGLFSAKIYGEKYKVCVKEIIRYKKISIWEFGRVYTISDGSYVYDAQGCCSYKTKIDAIKAACEFFGVKSDFFTK